MDGRLNDILPEPVSPENEEVLLDLLKRKMAVSLDLAFCGSPARHGNALRT